MLVDSIETGSIDQSWEQWFCWRVKFEAVCMILIASAQLLPSKQLLGSHPTFAGWFWLFSSKGKDTAHMSKVTHLLWLHIFQRETLIFFYYMHIGQKYVPRNSIRLRVSVHMTKILLVYQESIAPREEVEVINSTSSILLNSWDSLGKVEENLSFSYACMVWFSIAEWDPLMLDTFHSCRGGSCM